MEISIALRRIGVIPTRCGTVGAACEALQEAPFDLVIANAELPDGAVALLLQMIRAARNAAPAPVLVLGTKPEPVPSAMGTVTYFDRAFADANVVADAAAKLLTDRGVVLRREPSLARSEGRPSAPFVAQVVSTRMERSKSVRPRAPTSPPRVLAVDDSVAFRAALELQLRGEGVTVLFAESGEEALAVLAREHVDCVLLDRTMPGLSGSETCRRMKAMDDFRRIPVIMLTATEGRDAVIESFEAGADDYISKASDPAIVRVRLFAQLRRKAQEDENEAMREELYQKQVDAAREQAANRAKGAFLAVMSHEIRTPMNAIIGMTQLLLDATLTADQRDLLGSMMSSAEALLQLINDVLDFSKIEAGRLELDPTEFRLRVALGEVLHALAIAAGLKRLELVCVVAADVPDSLIGDLGRLRQIVLNLVGNAIKFTSAGEVVVSVACDEITDTDVVLRITVRDTGIGIDDEKCKHIFDPFEQADNTTTRRFGGTGLGLSISAKLVDLMQGRIWVESRPGAGAKFCFTVKLARGTGVEHSSRAERLQGIRVLVVEDNDAQRAACDELLQTWKVRGSSVANGGDALAAMERALSDGDPFGVALIDADMPGMSGNELMEQIRKHAAHERTKLVVLVPAGVRSDRYQQLGAAAHVRKPLSSAALLDGLLTALGEASGVADSPFAVRRGVEASLHPLRILLAEDNLINQKFAVLALEKMGHRVTVVGDGRQASRRFEAQRFDAILMDVQMPEMDGLEATREIRAREAARGDDRVVIIAMTAEALKGDRERCLAAGMDMYIAKPFRIEELAMSLARVARRDPDEEADGPVTARSAMVGGVMLRTSPTPDAVTTGRPSAARVSPTGDDERNFDVEAALTRAAGETDLLREVVGMILKDAPGTIERLGDALLERDFERLRRLAHNLKGASANLGGDRLARALHALEGAARGSKLELAEAAMSDARVAWTAFESELLAWIES